LATIVVELRRLALAAVTLAACARPEVATVAPPESQVPEIRIGVVTNAATLSVGGGAALRLVAPDGSGLIELPPGTQATVAAGPPGLRIRLGGVVMSPGPAVELSAADSGGPVRINAREYRGRFVLSASLTGVSAISLVDVEQYLDGVVGAEMGRRAEPELAALRAQAVISRTIALKSLGRWRTRGYDLVATVADQAYSGIGFETPVSTQAVQETRGEVLLWQGQLIDGFFHSTCGGRTADGPEVFVAASRPYLRSIRDEDPAGRPWCAISPRFRWRESWSGELLARTLTETLPQARIPSELGTTLRDLRIVDRTPTGRVAHLELSGTRGTYSVSGPVARLLLRAPDGGILRSANFTVQLTRSGGRIVQLVADGSGAGHGVGMCQWGALARSRAGFSYQDILSAYFPGTELSRTY
jgi:stage II sporulation protein D (peptidoglycan lytic transglycosylase)